MHVYKCPKCPAKVSLVEAVGTITCEGCLYTMVLLPDSAVAAMPLEPNARAVLGPLNVDTLKSAGILLPATQHALDWLWRHRKSNGMAAAFLKVGGRRCVDLVAFARLMRERRA